jgi:plasmid stabilization system protein ParE
MEKKIIITKRFRNNALNVYQYLLKNFSADIAYKFLQQLEIRIDFIANNPTVGKSSVKRKNVRSVLFTPYNQIFYRYQNGIIEILCLFDMRKNPGKRPY